MRKSQLVTHTLWFFVGLVPLLILSGSPYILGFPWPESAIAQLYTLTAFVSYLGCLIWLAWPLVVGPLIWAGAPERWVYRVCIVVGAAVLAFVQVDALVFATNRFHLSMLALRVLGTPTAVFAGVCSVVALATCFLLIRVVRGARPGPRTHSRVAGVLALLLGGLVVSQAIHAWADVRFYVPVTSFTPYLPLYRPLTGKHLLSRWLGAVDLDRARADAAIEDLGAVQEGVLDYPKQALQCDPPERPLNVMLIGVDAMRADYVVDRVVPNIAEFAASSLRFESHWSGGNGTRPGLFSLFYAIPATYWGAFYAAQQAPVLIETFQRHGYAFGIFPSNPADRLVGLERTAFRTIPDLPSSAGDVAATDGWLRWFDQHDPDRPFFSFLFYESAPGACPEEYERVSEVDVSAPGDAGRRACYETALHFADAQIGRVLERLRSSSAFENTIIILTSDHGEEFNENGLGFRGHGSSYSRQQLRTPFLVRWPGHLPGVVSRRTSHNDVAPTLLSEVLGCKNPPSDYSSGHSLFDEEGWPWLVAASYTSQAIVEPERVTVSYGSYFEVRDADYRLLADPRIDAGVISDALRETGRFMRR